MRKIKLILKNLLFFTAMVLAVTITCNLWVIFSTQSRVHTTLEKIPENEVALVLGTSKRFMDGRPNRFFKYRMEAAADLFKQGGIKHLILSGDNNTRYYNEPADMKTALLALGVPTKAITLDYAGFRTLDSIIRCKEIFGQEKITIVTQKFHSYRALFISDFYELQAEVYAAQNIPLTKSIQVVVRELFARPKAIIDLYLLKKSPKFLGEKEVLEIE